MGTFFYHPDDGRRIYGEWTADQLVSTVIATFPDGTRCALVRGRIALDRLWAFCRIWCGLVNGECAQISGDGGGPTRTDQGGKVSSPRLQLETRG